MKVSELIKELSLHDPETEIFLVEPANNYWRHVKVLPITDIGETMARHSSYNDCLIQDTEPVEDSRSCLVLSASSVE